MDVVLLGAQLQVLWVNAASVMTPVPDHFILSREHALRRYAALGLVCAIIKNSISCHKVLGYLILRLWQASLEYTNLEMSNTLRSGTSRSDFFAKKKSGTS